MRRIKTVEPIALVNETTGKQQKVFEVRDGKNVETDEDEVFGYYRTLASLVFNASMRKRLSDAQEPKPPKRSQTWDAPYSRVKMRDRILRAFDPDLHEGGVLPEHVDLRAGDWRKLCDSIDADDFALPDHYRQLCPIIDSILDADKVKKEE